MIVTQKIIIIECFPDYETSKINKINNYNS